jgi:hypothetical protein
MESYMKRKKRKEREFEKIPLGFAFGKEQFQKMLIKMGLTEENCAANLYSIGSGGYIKKSDNHLLRAFADKNIKEEEELKKNEEYMYQAFSYELANHEYCVTYEVEETLDSMDLTEDEVNNNPVWSKALNRAKKDYSVEHEMYL